MPGSGPLIGRPEALRRFPWLSEATWSAAAERFPVHVPRAYVGDARDPADPRLRTALPDAAELADAVEVREGEGLSEALRRAAGGGR